jgi:hypothetical protein
MREKNTSKLHSLREIFIYLFEFLNGWFSAIEVKNRKLYYEILTFWELNYFIGVGRKLNFKVVAVFHFLLGVGRVWIVGKSAIKAEKGNSIWVCDFFRIELFNRGRTQIPFSGRGVISFLLWVARVWNWRVIVLIRGNAKIEIQVIKLSHKI